MTREEAIARIKNHKIVHKMNEPRAIYISEALDMAIKYLKCEPCEDCISREAARDLMYHKQEPLDEYDLDSLPSVTPKPKTGHCKDCKYFEYDSVAKVNGIPLIVAHEICSKWGDGCKTREDGYCFLYEQQESEVKE